jgi:DNA repair protein RecN (Recombination protein N)
MIDWLEIRHFAIAASVEIELEKGFSAVTGETGSGKSLMVDAVAVLLGARADNSMIQLGQDSAEIQCSFSLPAEHPVFLWLQEHDLRSQNELLLRRIIRRDKPSRGYINGVSVNISMLRELGVKLVDIHGQHEHHSLIRRPVQQALLDEAAGNQPALVKLGTCYDALSSLQRQMQKITSEQNATQERIDLLKFQLAELDQLNPLPEEWQQLERQQRRLQHHQELVTGCQSIVERLDQDDQGNINGELNKLIIQLRQLERYDTELGSVALLIEEAMVNTEEAARQLRDRYQSSEIHGSELEQVEQRFSSFHELSRKHRVQPQYLAEHNETLRRELDGLSNPDAELERLAQLIEKEQKKYHELCATISRARTKSSGKLKKQITVAMQELGMEGGRFDISLTPLPAGQISRFGNETVEFMVTANPGLPVQPLSKIASGGELSRISLAIQVILSSAAMIPTLVFDEVDVGIGGTVANAVGQRLRELGHTSQVICVTHLAQVAARADHHFNVAKEKTRSKNGGVDISIRLLDRDGRIEEIARMTGSDTITRQSRAHAEQMLASAC